MAKTFILQPEIRNNIDNKTGEITEIKDLKLCEFLQMMDNQYDYFYDEPFGSLTYEEMQQVPIKHCNVILGKSGITTFGFKFSYSKEYGVYTVRLLSPSTTLDWRYAMDFIKDFTEKFKCKIFGDRGEGYSYDTIENFDFRKNIRDGLVHLKEMFEKYNMEKVHLGTRDILTLDIATLDKILASDNQEDIFDEISKINCENICKRPEQSFYITAPDSETKGMFGYYSINFGEDFTLKISPNIEPRNNSMVNEYGEIQSWLIQFQKESGEFTPPLDYYFVVNNLPHEKVKSFGYDNIYVSALEDSEIRAIYEKFVEKMRFLNEHCTNYQDITVYDYYMWHYERVLKKELNVGRLATLNHMAYFLRFAIEKNLMSDYFKRFYSFIDRYLKITNNILDLREILLYSMGGRVDSLIFNEAGNRLASALFNDGSKKRGRVKFVDICAQRYLGKDYEKEELKGEGYLFTPYSEEYYHMMKEVVFEPEFKKIIK